MNWNKKMETQIFFYLLVLTLAASGLKNNCFSSGRGISCMCNDTALLCSGVQDDETDVLEIVQNVTITSFFVNLQIVIINVANLSLHTNRTFKGLDLSYLKLTSDLLYLEDSLFSNANLSLKVLDLSHNSLSEIPVKSLNDMGTLHDLDLSNNNMSNLSAVGSLILPNLIVMSLRRNNISIIEDGTFHGFKNLQVLNLDDNVLSFLGKDIFEGLTNLLVLTLSGNNLQRLSTNTFSHLPSIEKLVLDDNSFSHIADLDIEVLTLKDLSVRNCSLQGALKSEHLFDLSNLTSVDFSFNNLSNVEEFALKELSNLQTLNLSYNEISYLDDNAFSRLSNLSMLDLTHNVISFVKKSAFSNLSELRFLNLSSNKLSAFFCEYTSDLISLENINLNNNYLKVLSSGTFMYSNNLKTLQMDGNLINCTCHNFDFATYLQNHSVFGTDLIKCASPTAFQGKRLIEVNFSSMACSNSMPCYSQFFVEPDDLEDNDTTTIVTPTVYHSPNVTNSKNTLFIADTTDLFLGYFSSGISNVFENITDISSIQLSTTLSDIFGTSTANVTVATKLDTVDSTSGYTNFSVISVSDSNQTFFDEPKSSDINATEDSKFSSSTDSFLSNVTISTKLDTVDSTSDYTGDSTSGYTNFSVISLINSNQTFYIQPNSSYMNATEDFKFSSSENFFLSNVTSSAETVESVSPTHKNPVIDILNISLSNNNLYIGWIIHGKIDLKEIRCVLSYTYNSDQKSLKKISCPSKANVFYPWGVTLRGSDSAYDICVVIQNITTSRNLDKKCVSNVTSESTTVASNYTNRYTESSSFSEIITNQTDLMSTTSILPVSHFEINSTVLNGIHKSTTFIPSEPYPTGNKFNITSFSVSEKAEDSLFVAWEVNREESAAVCTLKLLVTFADIVVEDQILSCTRNNILLSNVTTYGLYDICLFSRHSYFGNDSMCRKYFLEANVKSSHDSQILPESQRFPIALLIGLFLLTLCIITILIIVVICKKTAQERYNVSKEERKVSTSMNRTNSIRYSYSAPENA